MESKNNEIQQVPDIGPTISASSSVTISTPISSGSGLVLWSATYSSDFYVIDLNRIGPHSPHHQLLLIFMQQVTPRMSKNMMVPNWPELLPTSMLLPPLPPLNLWTWSPMPSRKSTRTFLMSLIWLHITQFQILISCRNSWSIYRMLCKTNIPMHLLPIYTLCDLILLP